jgi:hypothetical protein
MAWGLQPVFSRADENTSRAPRRRTKRSGDSDLALLATPCSARGAGLPKTPPDDKQLVERAITESEACEALRLAVLVAATRSAGSIKDLRIALEQFTVTFRELGTTPEGVLIRLKKIVEQRSTPGLTLRSAIELSPIIREQMTTWCIQDYFRKGPPTPPERA